LHEHMQQQRVLRQNALLSKIYLFPSNPKN
jgi:hypothetical protein